MNKKSWFFEVVLLGALTWLVFHPNKAQAELSCAELVPSVEYKIAQSHLSTDGDLCQRLVICSMYFAEHAADIYRCETGWQKALNEKRQAKAKTSLSKTMLKLCRMYQGYYADDPNANNQSALTSYLQGFAYAWENCAEHVPFYQIRSDNVSLAP